MLAVVESSKHFRFYVLGRRFLVRTDHSALQWLRNFKESVGKMARWLERLAEYDFEIVHRAGKNHANADGLSRIPSTLATVNEDEQWITPSLKKEFSNQQKNDAVTSLLIEWLNKAVRPDDDEMKGTSRELRYYWARFNELLMKDGILGLLNNNDDGVTTTLRAIVSKHARQRILELAHSSAGGGHFGVQKL